jgi:hypothetical protein
MKAVSRKVMCAMFVAGIGFSSMIATVRAQKAAEDRVDRSRTRPTFPSSDSRLQRNQFQPTPSANSSARSSSSDTALSDAPKPMLVLTVWVVTLTNGPGHLEEDTKSSDHAGSDDKSANVSMNEYAKAIVKKFDKNANGTLESDERKELHGRAADADLNHDGTISVDELVKHLTEASPAGIVEASRKTSAGNGNNLPAEFNSVDEVREFLAQLKHNGRVRSSRELRMLTLDGQTAQVQVGADQPRVTATSYSNRGRQNQLMYRQVGTMIEARPRVDSEKRIQVQLDYNMSDVAKSNDIALSEEPDGKSQFADVTITRQFKSTASLKNGGAAMVHCDALAGAADKSGEGQTELAILAAALASP